MRIDAFFVCKQELGARQQSPRCPGRELFVAQLRAGASPCASSPQELSPQEGGLLYLVWWALKYSPARTPGPLLSSQIFHIRWQQFNERTDHPLNILLGLTAFTIGIYATFTGGPLARTSSYIEMSQPPKEGKYSYNQHPKTSPNILANVIILSYIF